MVRALRLSPTISWCAVGNPVFLAQREAEVRAAALAAGLTPEEIPVLDPPVYLPEE